MQLMLNSTVTQVNVTGMIKMGHLIPLNKRAGSAGWKRGTGLNSAKWQIQILVSNTISSRSQ